MAWVVLEDELLLRDEEEEALAALALNPASTSESSPLRDRFIPRMRL